MVYQLLFTSVSVKVVDIFHIALHHGKYPLLFLKLPLIISLPYQTLITDLDWACEMLQCGTQLLKDGLSKRTVQAGNERVSTHLTSVQVCFSLLKSI